MKKIDDLSISWNAPIIPSHSIAGIPLGLDVDDLNELLQIYLLDRGNNLYQFAESPVLNLKKNTNVDGTEIYLFSVNQKDLTNWHFFFDSPDHVGANPRALGIVIREKKVHAVKIWHFEKLRDGERPQNIYRGKMPGDIGLGDLVGSLLSYSRLHYDQVEEWFYTDPEYGGVEVTGYGDLTEFPDQIITALAVISSSGYVEREDDS